MKEIPISKGYKVVVDDEDYAKLSSLKWSYVKGGYAITVANSKLFKELFPDYVADTRLVLMHRLLMKAGAGVEVDHRS